MCVHIGSESNRAITPLNNTETEKVEITMISESSTTAAVKLVDYSELDLIKITGLTWTPALPASFVVSDIVKK